LKLGLNLGYWGAGNDASNLDVAVAADELGYDVIWAAEAYGSDAATVLSWVAAQTKRIDVGSAVFQIPGRTAANTAMTAATLDSLSGGRFRLGLGVSGPQVSEGWHGVKFDKPLKRTREYIEVVRLALARERVAYQGEFIQLPLPGGIGKSLRLTVHPVRDKLPIYLAAIGPKNLQLAGELADGWLGIFFDPTDTTQTMAQIQSGLKSAGREDAPFDYCVTVPVVFNDDEDLAIDMVRDYAALYIGGMGSKEVNFYNQLARRMGFEAEADAVQQSYLAKDYAAARAAVPREFIERTSLCGNDAQVKNRLKLYMKAGVTTLNVAAFSFDTQERIKILKRVQALLAQVKSE
jgi:F420-dependent oxidoreductase-like protein